MISSIHLPWPDRRLHPNARVHWGEKARVTKRARLDAAWEARISGVLPIPDAPLVVTAIFFPPDNRARDVDGMLASIKPALDGIADAIGVDDSRWSLALRREKSCPPGAVHIQIEVAE